MNKVTLASTTAVAILVAGLSFNAIASSKDDAASKAAQQNAEISLTQAINIAEQATGGKNSEAEFELEDGVAIYEVEIDMPDGSEIEVEVDAQSGEILAQKAEGKDKDCDDKHKKHDGERHHKADEKASALTNPYIDSSYLALSNACSKVRTKALKDRHRKQQNS